MMLASGSSTDPLPQLEEVRQGKRMLLFVLSSGCNLHAELRRVREALCIAHATEFGICIDDGRYALRGVKSGDLGDVLTCRYRCEPLQSVANARPGSMNLVIVSSYSRVGQESSVLWSVSHLPDIYLPRNGRICPVEQLLLTFSESDTGGYTHDHNTQCPTDSMACSGRRASPLWRAYKPPCPEARSQAQRTGSDG